MATATYGSAERFRQPPDTFFAFVAGLYLGALLAPACVALLVVVGTGDPALLYLSFLGAVTLLTAVGTRWVGRQSGVAQRIGGRRARWGLVAAPPVVGGGSVALGTTLLGSTATAVGGAATGVLGTVLGLGLAVMARNRYVKAVVDADRVTAEWEAGWPAGPRRVARVLAAGCLLLYFGGIVADVTGGATWVRVLTSVAIGPAVYLASAGAERRHRCSPAGVERLYPAYRSLYEWDALAAYEVREDVVLVHHNSWWRPALRFARADLDDEEGVRDALAARLPRR